MSAALLLLLFAGGAHPYLENTPGHLALSQATESYQGSPTSVHSDTAIEVQVYSGRVFGLRKRAAAPVAGKVAALHEF